MSVSAAASAEDPPSAGAGAGAGGGTEAMLDPSVKMLGDVIAQLNQPTSAQLYTELRSERDQATLHLMQRMGYAALANIRQEFFIREDSVSMNEFIYIMTKQLIKGNRPTSHKPTEASLKEEYQFGSVMFELFKEVDVNGDGGMEWDEFSKFILDKASHLNKERKLQNIRNYHDSSDDLDTIIKLRRRNEISHMCNIPALGHFALSEEHKKVIWIYNARNGEGVTTVHLNALPLVMEHVHEQELLIAACADMTMVTMGLGNPARRYQIMHVIPTPGVQMSIASMPSKGIVYSGSDTGHVYSWRMGKTPSIVATLPAHSKMVMNLLALKKLDNLISASLDTTIAVWDAYTNEEISRLRGHKNGVFSMAYNTESGLLISCGFDHDAFVWSPFVGHLVFKLKGHHASLVGCQSVDATPEVITADASGVFKLWDVRTFQCVQTFSKQASKKNTEKLSCFFHAKLPSINIHQHEDDCRVVAASKMVYTFDQKRVVHEKTADFTAVIFIYYNPVVSTIVTTSATNVTVWDALLGSKKISNMNMTGGEMTAFCLDDRKRKLIVGDMNGIIQAYNPSNGAFMKASEPEADIAGSAVVDLVYLEDKNWVIGAFANGLIKVFDETRLEDFFVLKVFDHHYKHTELSCMTYSEAESTVVTSGCIGEPIKLWDIYNGKIELEIEPFGNHSTESVVKMQFLEPFPLLVTSDSGGELTVWGSRTCRYVGANIKKFLNQTPNEAIFEVLDQSFDHPDLAESGFSRIVLPPKGAPGAGPGLVAGVGVTDGLAQMSVISESSAVRPPSSPMPGYIAEEGPGTGGSVLESVAGEEGETQPEETTQASIAESAGTESRPGTSNHSNKWGPVSSAVAIAWDPNERCLYTGDELGYLRKWSMAALIDELDGERMVNSKPKGSKAPVYSQPFGEDHEHEKREGTTLGENVLNAMLEGSPGVEVCNQTGHFCWAIAAHEESILCCVWCINGILTSATDRLVRMWNFEGHPIGNLFHSVPAGVRSADWNLKLDIDTLMKNEHDELDEVMDEVGELAHGTDIPEIDKNNLTSMIPGFEAAKYSESSFKKIIDRSALILGIDIQNSSRDDASDANSLGSQLSKHSQSALKELKGKYRPDKKPSRLMNQSEERRHKNSMDKLSKKYGKEDETGVKLPYINTNATLHEGAEERDDDSLGGSSLGSAGEHPGKARRFTSADDDKQKVLRNAAISKKCKKYSSYASLETAIADGGRKGSTASPADLEVIRRKRQSIITLNLQKAGLSVANPSALPPLLAQLSGFESDDKLGSLSRGTTRQFSMNSEAQSPLKSPLPLGGLGGGAAVAPAPASTASPPSETA
jgi:WD40 repeat protein